MQIDTEIAFSRKQIERTFAAAGEVVYSRADLLQFTREHQEEWQLDGVERVTIERPGKKGTRKQSEVLYASSTNVGDVLEMLLRETKLKHVVLPFPYRAEQRYTWGEVPTLRILQSLDDDAYYSHFTAMHLHGLTEQIPKSIYLNIEQRATGGGGLLTQGGIDRAFKGKCRVSNNVTTFRNLTICKLNGQNTGQLGVVPIAVEEGFSVRVTNLERTLIDATVRPVYSGGVSEVANAFRTAAARLSVNKLAAYLRKLNFTYPYHQAIGFYLEHTGALKPSQIDLLREFPIEYNFYLAYQMRDPVYNERWRLFVPQGL